MSENYYETGKPKATEDQLSQSTRRITRQIMGYGLDSDINNWSRDEIICLFGSYIGQIDKYIANQTKDLEELRDYASDYDYDIRYFYGASHLPDSHLWTEGSKILMRFDRLDTAFVAFKKV